MKTAPKIIGLFIRQNKWLNAAPITVSSRNYYKSHSNEENVHTKYAKSVAGALLGAVVIGSAIRDKSSKSKSVEANVEPLKQPVEAGVLRPDLPTYRSDEVQKHDSTTSFWVTYKQGVYDVTSFLPSHPGGEQILNAAGLSVEPFWNIYGMHKTQEVFQLLETYRIGNLHLDDVCDHSDEEMWAREPRRDPRLIVKTARPFNAEIPPEHQIQHFDTPSELFYVRQHMPVPELDAGTHRVTVTVKGHGKCRQTSLTLEDLGKLPQTTVRAALMCAGNRRSEMDKVKPVKGISWRGGAISSAAWRGVLLRDVLIQCGVQPHSPDGLHVILQGADIDATGTKFSTSIPLHMALSTDGRVLLATHMNGQPLALDHGHPIRAVVPGAPAVRSVKWLESITVSTDESSSHWHQKDYRAFNPSKTWETADFASAPPVYSLPVTSAICQPLDGDSVQVKDGFIEVKGYAYSGGGAAISRVDVTLDGREWTEATLYAKDDAPPRQHYAWTLWRVKLPVDKRVTKVQLCVKATDSNFNTQPERFEDIWNIRGILSNAYHRVNVTLVHE